MSRFYRPGKYKTGSLKLPERWEKYTNIGKVIPGTRILPFKTPLKEEICRRSLSECNWFTPALLLEKAPNLKLIIDLTQTDRFYSGEYFTQHGVHHLKILCPGGGRVLPPPEIIEKFIQTIDDFLTSKEGLNQDSLIGVHCTHGLNRTGYLICKYLVKNNVSPKDAIKAFEEARGHTIERELYTSDLLCAENSSTARIEEPGYSYKSSSSRNNTAYRDRSRADFNYSQVYGDYRNGGGYNYQYRNNSFQNCDQYRYKAPNYFRNDYGESSNSRRVSRSSTDRDNFISNRKRRARNYE